MKILHVIPTTSLMTGGPAVAVKGMARALSSRGHEVHIYTTDYGEERKGYYTEEEGGYKTVHFPSRFLGFYCYSPELKRNLTANAKNFDIVHIHRLWSYPTMIASRVCRRIGVPYIIRPCGMLDLCSFRQNFLKKSIYSILAERRNIDEASMVQFTSEKERKNSSHFKIKSPSAVIPLGINEEDFVFCKERGSFRESMPELAGRRFILFFGRIDPKKRLDLLIKVFKRLSSEFGNLALVIMGTGFHNDIEKVKGLLKKENIIDRAIMLGLIVGSGRFSIVRDAELVCLPSKQENFGMVLVESLACETPVVTSDRMDLSEQIEKEGAGFVTPYGDAESVYKSCRILLKDERRRDVMGANGRKWVFENYIWNKVIIKLEDLYGSLVKAH